MYNKVRSGIPTTKQYLKKVVAENEYYQRGNVNVEISTEALDELFVDDIRELCLQLGKVRYDLIKLRQAEDLKYKKFTKNDDYVLHTTEFENLKDEDAIKLVRTMGKNRKERRKCKYRIAIIDAVLEAIKIKAPARFLQTVLEGAKNTRHFEQYVEEMLQNEDLFVTEDK